MNPLVVLNLGKGNCQTGLSGVAAQLWLEGTQVLSQPGSLPPAPHLPQLYKRWQQFYEALHNPFGYKRSFKGSIEFEPESITNVSRSDFRDLCDQLKEEINKWLNSSEFRGIDQQLRTKLDQKESIRVIIETEDLFLQKLPWHLWHFFEHYDNAEIALSPQKYERVNGSFSSLVQRMRILVVLGYSDGINVQPDRMILEDADAETVVLKEPSRSELDKLLWNQKGWDIFFFAGHSDSKGMEQTGKLFLNADEQLSINQLRNSLKAAIKRGLKLAIFNSCDGLGLARALADLNLPQLIVMREPVLDKVAHTFLKNFLHTFSSGEPFYTAARHAREQLQGIETTFPCASWLPVIFQNPTETPITWQKVREQELSPAPARPLQSPVRRRQKRRIGVAQVLVASLAIAIPIISARALSVLQPLELPAYDYLMRSRPVAWDTQPAVDSRLLVVEITSEDIDRYRYPVPDETLANVLERLNQHQPAAIGVDLHRYQENPPGREQLIDQFDASNVITVCSFGFDDRTITRHPPEFSPEQARFQVGFSDLETDDSFLGGGSVIRRHLLSYDTYLDPESTNCATPYSFGINLALRFLETEGIPPMPFTKDSNWQLGDVIFKRLSKRTGAYQSLDGETSEILLNYRFNPIFAQRLSMTKVLEGDFDDSLIQDRIVLIGVTDEPFGNDYRETPYGSLPGVWVHAHAVSHILGAVLDERPLIGGLPQWGQLQWGDMLWIWGWALVGGVLVWRVRSIVLIGAAGAVVILGLRQICLMGLVNGVWLPLVPALLALVGTAGVLFAYRRGYLPVTRSRLSRRLS